MIINGVLALVNDVTEATRVVPIHPCQERGLPH